VVAVVMPAAVAERVEDEELVRVDVVVAVVVVAAAMQEVPVPALHHPMVDGSRGSRTRTFISAPRMDPRARR
jgi:hypothetical protein